MSAIATHVLNGISIHSTARVETSSILAGSMSLYYFNPLHREGGDCYNQVSFRRTKISIHSTARVETKIRGLEFT